MTEYSDNLTVADVGAVPDGNLFIDSDGDLCIAGRKNNLVACLATDDADGNWQPLNPDVFPEIVRRWNAHPPQPSETVAEALEAMLHAVCGETGFAACVRHDSGLAYPWPALEAAEEKARSVLRALKGDE